MREADALAVVLLHESDHQRIRRRADQRAEPADGRGVGHTEHDGAAEVPRVAVVRGGIRRHDRRHRHRNRQHHERGGGVLRPHADEARGAHHPEHEPLRVPAGPGDDRVGDAPVQVAALHREPEQEAAEDRPPGGLLVGGDDKIDHLEYDPCAEHPACGELQRNSHEHEDPDFGVGKQHEVGRDDAGDRCRRADQRNIRTRS